MNTLMNKSLPQFLLAVAFLALSGACAAQHDAHDHEEEAPTGSHGGRLLVSGSFELELQIYETGVEPQFRAWAYDNEQEIENSNWELTVNLTRLGGEIDRFNFAPVNDDNYLLGDRVVSEPHSFDVSVSATYGNQTYSFAYESHEGRLQMSPEIARRMGVEVAPAGPQTIHETVGVYGSIKPDPNQIAHLHARYPGVIQQIDLDLGDRVERGEVIAIVQANDSLQSYELHAPITGLVVDIHANEGELAGAESLLTLANYETVWVELDLFPGQIRHIKPGQVVSVSSGDLSADTTISYLNPGEGQTPFVMARASLDNPDQLWTPGLLVQGEIDIADHDVDLAVANRAIQQYRDWDVVFIRIGDSYEIRPLELGRSDGEFTEVLGGLNVGDNYVVESSYLLKADLEKSGAEHTH